MGLGSAGFVEGRALHAGIQDPSPDREKLIVLHGSAYFLQDATVENDALRFRALARRGLRSDPLSASAPRKGLRCWRGPVLDDLEDRLQYHPGSDRIVPIASPSRGAVRRPRAGFRAGRAGCRTVEPVAEQEALDETVQARLIAAMAAAGRPAAAITRYDRVRRRLSEDLGIDPGNRTAGRASPRRPSGFAVGGHDSPASLPPRCRWALQSSRDVPASSPKWMHLWVSVSGGLPSQTAACRITGTAGKQARPL